MEKILFMKKWYGLLWIVITVNCYSQSAADNNFKLGMIKLNQGYSVEAITFFNSVLKQSPDYSKAYIYRAKAKLILTENSEAMNDINKAISIDKNNPDAYYIRANIYSSQSENEKALADLDKAIKLNSNYQEAIADKYIIKYSQSKDKKIIEELSKEIKKKESPCLLYARGILLNIEEKYGKAMADLTKSLTIDSTFNTFEIYWNKSYSLLQSGKNEEALDEIKNAIRIKPGLAKGYLLRGQVLYDAREYKKALEDFETVLKINAGDSYAVLNSGMCYLKLEDLGKACDCFHNACQSGNENGCKMSVIHCSKK